MNSFLIRRLAPFLICYICLEILAALYLGLTNINNVDWTVKTIIQDIGVLQLTSLVSFLFMVLPYVFYLTILPEKYQNSQADKIISSIIFTVFIFLNILENTSAIIFWNEFNILKDISIDNPETYLKKAQSILINIYQEYPLIKFISVIVLFSLIIWKIMNPYLFTKIKSPRLLRRLFHFILYICVCVLAFMNIDIEELNNNINKYNSQISEDRTYGILNGFVKKNSRLMLLRHYPDRNSKIGKNNDNQ